MNAMKKMTAMSIALLALACSKTKPTQDATLSDQLRSDLDRAAAPTSDLASTQFRPTNVVSAVELGNAPVRASAVPQKRPVRRAAPSVKAEVAPVPSVALDPAPAPTTVAVVPAPLPDPGPRPTPNPVAYPSGSGTEVGGGGRGGIGGVIGVIIRGGTIGDDDHCEIHGPGSIPIAINSRIPIGVGGPTFPRRRGGW